MSKPFGIFVISHRKEGFMNTPKIAIVSIGTELTQGFTLNTNTHWLSEKCRNMGFEVAFHLSLPDQLDFWKESFQMFIRSKVQTVIVTGGLGPTSDDITRNLVANTFNKTLVYDPQQEKNIQHWFQKRGIPYLETNKIQAYFPEGAQVLENKIGSAPGFLIKDELTLFSLPGVPSEMKSMFQLQVIPELQKQNLKPYYFKDLRLFGISESALESILQSFQFEKGVFWSSLPTPEALIFRLYTSKSMDSLEKAKALLLKNLGPSASQMLISDNGETLAHSIIRLLRESNQKIAFAESCTGGLLSYSLIQEAGASDVLQGSVIAYNNEIKENLLKVQAQTLLNHGAVSQETVLEMAQNTLKIFNSDWAIATSGIAGPTGATPEKPIGLVWIAIVNKCKKTTFSEIFIGNRKDIQEKSVYKALNKLRIEIIEQKNTCS